MNVASHAMKFSFFQVLLICLIFSLVGCKNTPTPEPESSKIDQDRQEDKSTQLNLLGKEKLILTLGDAYSEPGYEVSSESDETFKIEVTGLINENQAGKYTLTYRVIDSAGNYISAIQRDIFIVDPSLNEEPPADEPEPAATEEPTKQEVKVEIIIPPANDNLDADITLIESTDYTGFGPSLLPIYNYGEALQMSWYFYEAQRSGLLPKHDGDLSFHDPRTGTKLHNGFFKNRIPWRGDSGVTDGADVNIDLTGGWHDAGDHVKFGLPMAYSASILAWGVLEFPEGLTSTGQMKWAKDNLRWVGDYFIKAHSSPNELYGQVGEGAVDHSIWGPPEVLPHVRPAWKIDEQNPGPDLAAQTAAALTTISLIFRDEEPVYANVLLQRAIELYDFAMATLGPAPNLGHYSDSIIDSQNFYRSNSGAKDDIPFAAAWLYKATKNPRFLHDAESYYTPIADNTGHTGWTLVWDDVRYGVYVLMSQIYSDPDYAQDSLIQSERKNGYYDYNLHAQNFFQHWLRDDGIPRTPAGMAWLAPWASARYNTSTAFLMMVYRKHLQSLNTGSELQTNYLRFATEQVNYILGNNPLKMSYMVGFGDNFSQVAHHRAAHGSTTNSVNTPELPRHILYGALAGGPDKSDGYTDDRSSFAMTEVATDMNAGLNGLLAGLVSSYGLTNNEADPNFPPVGAEYNEIYIKAKLQTQQISELGSGVLVTVVNESVYPPRASDGYKFRYFVNLSEIFQAGYTLDDLILDIYWDEGKGAGVTLNRWQDAAYIFYIEGSFEGTIITPLGSDKKQKNIDFLLRLPWTNLGWNPSNDPSYAGLIKDTVVITDKIVLYDTNLAEDEQRIWGIEPEVGLLLSEVPDPAEIETGSVPANSLNFDISIDLYNQWATGHCARFVFTNNNEISGSPTTFDFYLSSATNITTFWNGSITRAEDVVGVTLSNIGVISPGESNQSFGYCANAKTGPSLIPLSSIAEPTEENGQMGQTAENENSFTVQIDTYTQWANNYCTDFFITNTGENEAKPKTLSFEFNSSNVVNNHWNGQINRDIEDVATVTLPDAVAILAPGQSRKDFGFCVTGAHLPANGVAK